MLIKSVVYLYERNYLIIVMSSNEKIKGYSISDWFIYYTLPDSSCIKIHDYKNHIKELETIPFDIDWEGVIEPVIFEAILAKQDVWRIF